MEYIIMLLKLIFAMTIVLGLMFLVFKISGEKLEKLNNKKNMQILERLQVSKDSAITIVKVLDRGYVLSTSNKGCEKIDTLTSGELEQILQQKELQKKEVSENYGMLMDKVIQRLPKKIIRQKEEKHEK